MNDMTQNPWTRMIVEGAVIVAGILFAFAVDAWWGERQERQLEHETLLSLQSEYQDHRAVLGRQKAEHLRYLDGLENLMEACERGSWQSDELSVDVAMMYLLSPTTTDLGAGVLDSLISAGNIEIISDKQLRYELAEWQSVLDELSDDQQNASKLILEYIVPYLARKGTPLGGFVGLEGTTPASARTLATDSDAMARLFSDAEFRSILEIRHDFARHASGEFDRVIAAIESILTGIDASLDSG